MISVRKLIQATVLALACWTTVFFSESLISMTLATQSPMTVIAAGVPRFLAEDRDYDLLFSQLADHHITAFLPTFQYQEHPTSLSLGYEADFLPPCHADDAAFEAMRTYNIKLIVPGQLLYAIASSTDPLQDLIACAGTDMIAAVLSIDEPFGAITDWQSPNQDVETLYNRVKTTDPNLPVMMVHAPVAAHMADADGSIHTITSSESAFYLETTRKLSEFSDIVGFDVYPIARDGGTITTPQQAPRVPSNAGLFIADYLNWIHENIPGRPSFMVLQSFSFSRQYAEPPYTDLFPTQQELKLMACQVLEYQGQTLVWWGQSFLKEGDEAFWQSVLTVSENIATNGRAYCSEV